MPSATFVRAVRALPGKIPGLAALTFVLVLLTAGRPPALDADVPAPLPASPDYLESLDFSVLDAAPASPPATGRLVISPPSRFMPPDYFDLPVDLALIEEGIPGIVMPELDDTFAEPAPRTTGVVEARPGRVAAPGLTVAQLEPYFARAKGDESAALAAKRSGDESAHARLLAQSIAGYQGIVSMADAANEAREEAWYGVARCEYRLGNWWRAFDALERSFPKQFDPVEVAGRVKLEMFIGERLWRQAVAPVPGAIGKDGQTLSGYQAAARVYAAVVANQPMNNDSAVALLRQGDAAALTSNWTEAAKFYRQAVEYFPESEAAMQARSSLTEAIYRQEHPAGFPEAARDDVATIMDDVERAAPILTPESAERRQRAVAVANDLEAANKLRQAKEYMKAIRVKKSRDAAVFLLGDIVSHYPNTPQAGEAAAMLRKMGVEPPMVLSDGNRFPVTAGWSGAERQPAGGGFPGGSVVVSGQDNRYGDTSRPDGGK